MKGIIPMSLRGGLLFFPTKQSTVKRRLRRQRTRMPRSDIFSWLILFALTIILTACGNPTPVAVSPIDSAPAENSNTNSDVVIASAVAAPLQVSKLGLVTSGLVKEVDVKEGDVVQAGQILIVLDAPDLELDIIAAEASLRAANVNLFNKNREKYKWKDGWGRIIYSTVPREIKDIAKEQVRQAEIRLEIAKAILAQATLVAPYDGTVVSIEIIPGEAVQVDQTVLTLASLNTLQIETTDLSERDITRVKIGQPVNVSIEALNVTVTGKVIRISPISETVGGDVVFPVTIELDEQPDGLLWGMTAEVEIISK